MGWAFLSVLIVVGVEGLLPALPPSRPLMTRGAAGRRVERVDIVADGGVGRPSARGARKKAVALVRRVPVRKLLWEFFMIGGRMCWVLSWLMLCNLCHKPDDYLTVVASLMGAAAVGLMSTDPSAITWNPFWVVGRMCWVLSWYGLLCLCQKPVDFLTVAASLIGAAAVGTMLA